MQHLRIIGMREDAEDQLVLSDDAGNEYSLLIDEALRSAVGRPHARPSRSSESSEGQLTPREIQARLRAGQSVEEVVEASGLPVAHVERYAGPVKAERGYTAQRARSTEIAPASFSEQHRLSFGDAPATLEAMVKVRLRAMGVDLKTMVWDAWRRENGQWQVACWFDVDTSATQRAGIGMKPPAEWVFHPATRHLVPDNRWAESLSSLPEGPSTKSRPRKFTAVEGPFDVEAESGDASSFAPLNTTGKNTTGRGNAPAEEQETSPVAGSPGSEGGEHEDLLDVLRARRGQRLGADEEADDRLAIMLTRDEQPQEPGPRLRAVDEGRQDPRAPGDEESFPAEDGTDRKGPEQPDPDHQDTDPVDAWGFSYDDAEEDSASPTGPLPRQDTLDPHAFGEAPAAEDDEHPTEPVHRHARRGSSKDETSHSQDSGKGSDKSARSRKNTSRRPSMPKWDDILFGGKD